MQVSNLLQTILHTGGSGNAAPTMREVSHAFMGFTAQIGEKGKAFTQRTLEAAQNLFKMIDTKAGQLQNLSNKKVFPKLGEKLKQVDRQAQQLFIKATGSLFTKKMRPLAEKTSNLAGTLLKKIDNSIKEFEKLANRANLNKKELKENFNQVYSKLFSQKPVSSSPHLSTHTIKDINKAPDKNATEETKQSSTETISPKKQEHPQDLTKEQVQEQLLNLNTALNELKKVNNTFKSMNTQATLNVILNNGVGILGYTSSSNKEDIKAVVNYIIPLFEQAVKNKVYEFADENGHSVNTVFMLSRIIENEKIKSYLKDLKEGDKEIGKKLQQIQIHLMTDQTIEPFTNFISQMKDFEKVFSHSCKILIDYRQKNPLKQDPNLKPIFDPKSGLDATIQGSSGQPLALAEIYGTMLPSMEGKMNLLMEINNDPTFIAKKGIPFKNKETQKETVLKGDVEQQLKEFNIISSFTILMPNVIKPMGMSRDEFCEVFKNLGKEIIEMRYEQKSLTRQEADDLKKTLSSFFPKNENPKFDELKEFFVKYAIQPELISS